MKNNINRREFLGRSGLTLAVVAAPSGLEVLAMGEADDSSDTFSPTAWYTISPDNSITVMVSKVEMGQGTHTALAMLIAEELDADWTTSMELADTPEQVTAEETAGAVPLAPEEARGKQTGTLGQGDPRAVIHIPIVDTEDESGRRDEVLLAVAERDVHQVAEVQPRAVIRVHEAADVGDEIGDELRVVADFVVNCAGLVHFIVFGRRACAAGPSA